MRLVDFLVLILEAHAETLKRLAAFFGEELFLEMLENSSTDEPEIPKLDSKLIPFAPIGSKLPAGARSPYVELEGFVRELRLPAVLEFHLWAYPYYRAYIESDLDLGSQLSDGGQEAMMILVDKAIAEAKQWAQSLPIPPAVSQPAEAAAGLPWIRFRTSALRKMGLRPMGPVV